jgi:energy-coupling factor transport system substrate-specific component
MLASQWVNRIIRFGVLGLALTLTLSTFGWPLLVSTSSSSQAGTAQFAGFVVAPLILSLVYLELSSANFGPRQLAVLSVLIALNGVIRLLGAGAAGIETAFFIVIIAAYVFGSSFGFILGSSSLLFSAVLSGGFGPWLPFQMLAIGLIGFLAGTLPRSKNPRWLLIAFAVPASFIYGGLMTMWNWPYLAGLGSSVSYLPGSGILDNLVRFIRFEIVTGGLIWDLGRAITTSVLIAVTATTLLATLNRAAIRVAVEKL